VLLIDSSDDHRSVQFHSEKIFLKDLIDQVKPESNNARISLYTFGRSAYSQFTLGMYSSAAEMQIAVEYMWYATGNGNADTAIQSTILDAFKNGKGERACIPNILIVLTHSQISNTEIVSAIAHTLEDKRIQCIFINMAGTNANADMLTLTNTMGAILTVNDFRTLEAAAKNVTQMMYASK